MSGTLGGIYSNASFALRLHSNALARLQEQASTGSRVNRASDAPSAAHQILELASQKRSLANYMDNILEVIGTLEVSMTVIQEITSNIFSAETRTTGILSGTYNEQNRKEAARDINEILEQIVSLANTQKMGQYLYGGDAGDSAPYTVQRTNGQITSVTYQGSDNERNVDVAEGVTSSGFLVGDNLFRSNDRQAPIFPDSGTGAAAGTGTSTVRGMVWLDVIYEDSTYKMSIDGGAGYVAVDGTDNQAVTDSTGRVLYVDTTGINSTGTDLVRVPGTFDIFETLISIRDALASGNTEQISYLQQEAANVFSEIKTLLTNDSVLMGTRIGSLSGLKNTLENLKFNAEDETSRLQDADIAQVAVDIARREILYEMSLATAAKLFSLSLLDFLG